MCLCVCVCVWVWVWVCGCVCVCVCGLFVFNLLNFSPFLINCIFIIITSSSSSPPPSPPPPPYSRFMREKLNQQYLPPPSFLPSFLCPFISLPPSFLPPHPFPSITPPLPFPPTCRQTNRPAQQQPKPNESLFRESNFLLPL